MSEEKAAGAGNLLGIGTWVRQGPATLVIRDNAWVVLVPGLRKQVTEAAWELLGSAPDPEQFLDGLVAAGGLESADKLSALLFGFHDGSTGVFGVKGATPIAVYTPEGSQLIAGTDEEPFVLKTVEGVRRTAFGDLPAEEALGAPRLSSGVIPVRGFVHVTEDPATLGDAERADLAEQVEKDGRSIEDPEAKKRRASRPTPAPKPAGSSAAAPLARPAVATRKPGEMPPSISRGGSRDGSIRPAAAEPTSAGPNMFAGLFGNSSSNAAPAATAEPPAPAPAPAPVPEPVPAPAAESTSVPASAIAGAQSAEPAQPDAAPAAPAAPAAVAPVASTPAKRRLVSTSLFDRGRRASTAKPSSEETAAETAEPATLRGEEVEPTPDTPSALTPSPAATDHPAAPTPGPSARPATLPAAAAPPALVAPTPSSSIPTPDPPYEDEFESPPTQIAPIDDEDQEAPSAPTPAPRRVPRHTAARGPATSELENTGAYDDLFGKTVFRRVEDAAVRRSEDEEEAEDAEAQSAAAGNSAPVSGPTSFPAESTAAAPASPAAAPAPHPAEPATGGEFIDWVPGVGRTAPEIAQTAARRATEVPPQQPAYPQVHMAERPPAPHSGPRSAPAAPPSAPIAPYGGPMSTGVAGQQVGYPMPPGQEQPYAHGPANPGAAGHQLGFPGPARGGSPNPGHPAPAGPQYRGAYPASPPPRQPPSASPGAAGAAAPTRYPQQHLQQPPSATGGYPPVRSSAPTQGQGHSATGGPMSGRHASAPHPVAPAGPLAASAPRQGQTPQPGPGSAASEGGPGHVVGGGVTLTGVVCLNGHANSPERSVCRACGAPLQGEPRTVVRPPLGAVALSGGGGFVLDRTAIIGRRPRASRVSGHEVPQLITVPSPQQDISRSHLELRLEGWHVVALDLGTTNGTTLYREGYEPVRLRSREGVVLHDGDHLDLGDGVHLKFRERL